MEIKICTVCLKEKSIIDFHKQYNRKQGKGLRSNCKDCHNSYGKNYYKTMSGKKICKNTHLKRKYGLTMDQYNEMLKLQNDLCFICNQPNTGKNKNKSLCVDHCHKTGKVRKLLCFRCNSFLQKIEENDTILNEMKEYLEMYE